MKNRNAAIKNNAQVIHNSQGSQIQVNPHAGPKIKSVLTVISVLYVHRSKLVICFFVLQYYLLLRHTPTHTNTHTLTNRYTSTHIYLYGEFYGCARKQHAKSLKLGWLVGWLVVFFYDVSTLFWSFNAELNFKQFTVFKYSFFYIFFNK